MSKTKVEIQKFRHRGFEPNDGTEIIMMFGSDAEPSNADGSPMKKLWDNLVEQRIQVSKFIEPSVDAGTIADPIPPAALDETGSP